jgi:hypothetical protein
VGTGLNACPAPVSDFVSEAFFGGQKRFGINGIIKNMGNEPNFVRAHVRHRNAGWQPLIPNNSQKNLRNEPNFAPTAARWGWHGWQWALGARVSSGLGVAAKTTRHAAPSPPSRPSPIEDEGTKRHQRTLPSSLVGKGQGGGKPHGQFQPPPACEGIGPGSNPIRMSNSAPPSAETDAANQP